MKAPAPLGGETLDEPTPLMLACVAETVVQAVGPALPELDAVGGQHIAAPAARAAGLRGPNSGRRVLSIWHPAPRDPEPPSPDAKPRPPIAPRAGGSGNRLRIPPPAACQTSPADRDLALLARPIEHQGGLRVFGQLLPLAALVVGVEDETALVHPLKQDHPPEGRPCSSAVARTIALTSIGSAPEPCNSDL